MGGSSVPTPQLLYKTKIFMRNIERVIEGCERIRFSTKPTLYIIFHYKYLEIYVHLDRYILQFQSGK